MSYLPADVRIQLLLLATAAVVNGLVPKPQTALQMAYRQHLPIRSHLCWMISRLLNRVAQFASMTVVCLRG